MNNFPEFLYKYRALGMSGLITYKHIEDNIYEDTSCSDHVNCRIAVVEVGDHYEFLQPMNDSARKHEGFHKAILGDTHYYADSKAPMRVTIERWIREKTGELNEKLGNLHHFESQVHDKGQIKPVKLDLPFATTIYMSDEKKTQCKVLEKVYNKDGLAYLVTTFGYRVYADHDGIRVKYLTYDEYDNEVTAECRGFLEPEQLDTYLDNLYVENMIQIAKKSREKVEKLKQRIEELKASLVKYQ